MRGDEFPTFCPDCGVELEYVARLLELKRIAEGETTKKAAAVARLTSGRNKERRFSPFAAEAEELFEYWRERLWPEAREFGDKRFDAVVGRLEKGYSLDDLKRAVDGCARKPYVTDKGRAAQGSEGDREVELELICRSPIHVDRFKRYAEEPVSNVVELPVPQRRGDVNDPFSRPLDRALIALRREFGFDAVWKATDRDEWWSVCPLHPSEQTPMRLTEKRGAGSSLQAACVNGCLPSLILNAVRGLENKRELGLVGVPVTQLRARESA